ncbi:MAG: hypothetical protein GY830_11045 [Bacteroidetes bacterium]|nr:hypothetical protein [Bacteroidota bacterium]
MINSIRKKGGLLVGFITLLLILFISSQGIKGVMPFLYGNKNKLDIGEVAGQKIQFQDYDKVLSRFRSEFSKQKQKTDNIQDVVWNNYIREMIMEFMYPKEYQKLGLRISEDELIDMIQGEHIHPFIKRIFINKDTKEFDKDSLLYLLQTLDKRSEQEQSRWYYLEVRTKKQRLIEKLNSLMSNSIYITDIELDHENKFEYSSLDLDVIYIPYDSIPDTDIKIKDGMLKTYLMEHQDKYKVKETIDIVYAKFYVHPSKEDEVEVNNETDGLVEKFKKAQDSLAFAQTHTDGMIINTHRTFKYRDLRKKFPNIKRWRKGKVIKTKTDLKYEVYKLFKIRQKKKGGFDYEMAVLERHISASDKTKDAIYRKADIFANNVKNKKEFDEETKLKNIETHYAKQIPKNAKVIGTIKNARGLVRWLYIKDKKKKVSPVFEIDNQYIVAIPIKHSKGGLTELEYVKDKITKEVLKMEKAKIIKTKLADKNDTKLRVIAKRYGKQAKFLKFKNIHFKNSYLKNIGNSDKTIGLAFSLKNKNDRTEAFEDKNGVLILELKDRKDSKLENQEGHRLNDIKAQKMMEPYNVYLALENLANVKDYRTNFY